MNASHVTATSIRRKFILASAKRAVEIAKIDVMAALAALIATPGGNLDEHNNTGSRKVSADKQ
jgi:hypothetical protein